MTKHKAIIQAWGDLWDRLSETARRKALENEGFVRDYHLYAIKGDKPKIDFEFTCLMDLQEYVRPANITGIESNNDWNLFPERGQIAPCDMWVCDWNGCRLPVLVKEGNPIHKNFTHYIKLPQPKTIIYNE